MENTAIMDAGDAVYGSLAECFITIGKRRYNFMNLTEFESKWDVTISDVKILGKVGMGHKAAGGKGTWKGTAHYNQSVLRTMANQYQKTGNLPYFEIQVSNEDPSSSAGRQLFTGDVSVTHLFLQSSRRAKKFWMKIFQEPLRAGICRKNSKS